MGGTLSKKVKETSNAAKNFVIEEATVGLFIDKALPSFYVFLRRIYGIYGQNERVIFLILLLVSNKLPDSK